MNLPGRLSSIDRVLSDPPLVHKNGLGTWSTARSAYEFMASILPNQRARTLETGLGVSTVLFTIWGCEHTCVVWSQAEADAALEYLESRGVSTAHLSFLVGSSTDILPRMSPIEEYDLFFIDGGHFFPVPIIDFYYGSALVHIGGTVVVDDYNLASVRLGLDEFLSKSPDWTTLKSTLKWQAFRKESGERLGIAEQPFLRSRKPSVLQAQNLVPVRVRPLVERLVRVAGIY